MPAKIKAPAKFFLPYQEAWIKDKSRIKVMEKGRQIGISWASAYALVRRCSMKGRRYDAWISSQSDMHARLLKEDCNRFAGILHTACKDLGLQVIDREKGISAYVLHFANGRRIHCMSSNADAQSGKRGDRVLDEFALHPDPSNLWSIAYPGITWGGQMEVISTHRGSQSFFAQLIDDARNGENRRGISLHRVTLADALDQGFLSKLQSKIAADDPIQDMDEGDYYNYIKAGCANEESFLQEYMCQPSDDKLAYIDYPLIDACSYARAELWELPLDYDKCYTLGMDIGRTNDNSCIYIIELRGKMRLTRRIIVLNNMRFRDQLVILSKYASLPQIKSVCIDATGIGKQLAEDARYLHGSKVEELTFGNANKEDMALDLHRVMEDSHLRIPQDAALVADLRSIRRTTTRENHTRYDAPRSKEGHADRFWACALAIRAAKNRKGYLYLPDPLTSSLARPERKSWR